jgi:hypothetical protein
MGSIMETNFYCYIFFLPLGRKFFIAGKMTEVPIPPEEGSHQNAPEILEQGNIGEGNIWVNLNESRDNRQSELIQTVQGLREELQTVKEDNERILKTQEELNAILLEKLCNQNSDRNKGQFSSNSKTDLHKKKDRKFEHIESTT